MAKKKNCEAKKNYEMVKNESEKSEIKKQKM